MTGTRKTTAGRPARTVNLWPRRIITGLALLAVVALVVVGVVRLVGVLGGTASGSGGDAAAQSGQSGEDAQSGPGLNDATSGAAGLSSVIINACSADDLTVEAQAPAAVAVGDGASLSVTLTSTSLPDCSLTRDQLALRVVSGDQVIYDGSACPASDGESGSDTPLLFATGLQWSGTLTWDGRLHDGCTAVDTDGDGRADVAGAGTYRLQVLLDGSRIGDQSVFEVQ